MCCQLKIILTGCERDECALPAVYGVTLAVKITVVPTAIVSAVENTSVVAVVTANPLPLNAKVCGACGKTQRNVTASGP